MHPHVFYIYLVINIPGGLFSSAIKIATSSSKTKKKYTPKSDDNRMSDDNVEMPDEYGNDGKPVVRSSNNNTQKPSKKNR